jgi:hypothetical protein
VFLKEYSDAVLASTPIETLLKLESTSIKLKNMEKAKDLEDRLASNREDLDSLIIQVQAGTDDRRSILHEGRFLPGAVCSAEKMWKRGREVVRKEDHPAVSGYDMGSLGLGGHVTPKGWLALADPGYSAISINLFCISNCGKRTFGKSDNCNEDNLRDVVEIGELKTAMRVLREAMSYVHPWNKSVSVLEGFLIQTNYCSAEVESLDNQAAIISQFVDYVLRENSNRWRGGESYLGLSELKSAWESFFGSRPQSLMVKKKEGGGGAKGGQGQQGVKGAGGGSQQGQGRKNWVPQQFFKDDICVMFNLGKCVKPPGHVTATGTHLRHVCNFRPDMSKPAAYCGAWHAASFYH